MIKSVTITNEVEEAVLITLNDIEPDSGLFITEIEGLGPAKADINMTKLTTQSGSKYNSSRANGRNIVMHVRFLHAESIEDVRLSTYKYFPLNRKITFHIETDRRIAEVEGYIESNEPDIFSEEESATISIVCESPWFIDSTDNGIQVLPFSDVISEFEFEFSDDNSPSIIFSTLQIYGEKHLYYRGEAETGVIFSIIAIGQFTDPIVYNNMTKEYMKLSTEKILEIVPADPDGTGGSSIQYGDEILISTIPNNKYVKYVRLGKEYNIINALDKGSTWFKIHPGDNIFSYTSKNKNQDTNMVCEVRAQVLYQGV